ncbi:hypothetical protein RCL1_003888 [Eukaryota sp. TZLM3-RCL]
MLIQLKHFDAPVCVFEIPAISPTSLILEHACKYFNLKQKIVFVLTLMKELSENGFQRDPSLIDEDESSPRTGIPLSSTIQDVFSSVFQQAETLFASTRPVSVSDYEHLLVSAHNSLLLSFPDGIPDSDPLFTFFNSSHPSQLSSVDELRNVDTSALWFANKKLGEGNLFDYTSLRPNDKSKFILKLTDKSSGSPPSEPTVSEDVQKKLMSFYYKKQEELKRISSHNDVETHHSSWADSSSLRSSLQGLCNGIKLL